MRRSVFRVTCDTTVVIDALDSARAAAVELFARARAGELDVAFSTRLEYELRTHTLEEVHALVSRDIATLGTAGRYGASTYDGGDTYAAADSPNVLPPTGWRLDFGRLGIDTVLGGDGAGDISTPTLKGIGGLKGIDSDHLEAHRRDRRDIFVTSDLELIKAARKRGIDATTPEMLLDRMQVGEPTP